MGGALALKALTKEISSAAGGMLALVALALIIVITGLLALVYEWYKRRYK